MRIRMIFAGCALLLLSGCQNSSEIGENSFQAQHTFTAMDTVITLTLYGDDAESAVLVVEDELTVLDQLWSKTNVDSDISRLNENREMDYGQLDSRTLDMLVMSKQVTQQTEGTFDITLGNLVTLWGIGTQHQKVPGPEEVAEALSASGDHHFHLGDDKVALTDGISLDAGAIAKGYAADEIKAVLDAYRLDGGVVSLGGNVVAFGEKPDGTLWRVGIRDPRGEQDYLGYLTITDKMIVTSGAYERYFEQDGQRYHHIFDPATGYPSESDLISATVIHDNSALADAYSTALFVMGEEEALRFSEEYGIEFILVTSDNRILMDSITADSFTLTDNQYQLMQTNMEQG